MNMLVTDQDQIFAKENWQEKIKSPIRHTGNAMELDAVRSFSQGIDLEALRAYRRRVGQNTQKIVQKLSSQDFHRKVDPEQLTEVLVQGAVIEEANGIVEYWGKRDVAGLLLMPPTRHTIIHWNEARRIIKRL